MNIQYQVNNVGYYANNFHLDRSLAVFGFPLIKINSNKAFRTQGNAFYTLPLYASKICAGSPTPADELIETQIILNGELLQHPLASFLVHVSGDSMTYAGIESGDMLIVDRSIEAKHNSIVIAAVNGELTVKRLSCLNGRIQLLPANPAYSPIDITNDQNVIIWGVVTHVINEREQ